MKRRAPGPRVAILGCGRVGLALAVELLFRGRRFLGSEVLRVWSRSSRSTRALRALVGEEGHRLRVLRALGEAAAEADILLLCVADDAIAPMVERLARTPAARERTPVLLMTNGFLPLDVLARLARHGWAVGRMHPLSPVPAGAERTSPLHRSRYALQGDAKTVRAAQRIVRGMRGIPFLLADHPGAAGAYHSGASLLSGGLVALFHQCERVMTPSFRDAAEVRPALAHLIGATLWYTWNGGPEKALTGALSRGSEGLVRGHLEALEEFPEARALYCLLGQSMLTLARARGSIEPATERRLRRLLKSRAPRR